MRRHISPSALHYLRHALAQDLAPRSRQAALRTAARRRTSKEVSAPQPNHPVSASTRRSSTAASQPGPDAAKAPPSEPPSTTTTTTPPPQSRPRTHYDLFPATLSSGPPPAGPFEVDARALRREFLLLQAKAHPDLHRDEAAKPKAQALSSLINEAYKTLLDPLKRAQYLLSLHGIDPDKDEAAKLGDSNPAAGDSELLMQVMEAHETMEAARTERELDGLRGENEERIGESVGRLAKLFQEHDLEAARREAVRLRYWVNIREGIEGWERGKGAAALAH